MTLKPLEIDEWQHMYFYVLSYILYSCENLIASLLMKTFEMTNYDKETTANNRNVKFKISMTFNEENV